MRLFEHQITSGAIQIRDINDASFMSQDGVNEIINMFARQVCVSSSDNVP